LASHLKYFLRDEKKLQGRTKMIEDGIMDKRGRYSKVTELN
jgi:hypothetical protein